MKGVLEQTGLIITCREEMLFAFQSSVYRRLLVNCAVLCEAGGPDSSVDEESNVLQFGAI